MSRGELSTSSYLPLNEYIVLVKESVQFVACGLWIEFIPKI